MLGDVDLECISIFSFKYGIDPPTPKATRRVSDIGSWEADQEEEPPIFGDTTCNIRKTMKFSWHSVYKEF